MICFEKKIIKYLKAINSIHKIKEFLDLITYLSSFFLKWDVKIYIIRFVLWLGWIMLEYRMGYYNAQYFK